MTAGARGRWLPKAGCRTMTLPKAPDGTCPAMAADDLPKAPWGVQSDEPRQIGQSIGTAGSLDLCSDR